ncbi:MAG: hypothetical protein NW215_01755 [Hyphomicrobiales bacterium]|nr:hypothetical protein [Hyphomicrobiales bacterium]
MPAYFSGTINALRKGATRMSVDAAIKKIESWEEALQDVEITGVKAILRDLAALKRQLEIDEPDGDRVRSIMARLADGAMNIARKTEDRYSDKIMDLGEALEQAAEEDDEDGGYQSRSSGRSSGRSQSQSDDGRGEVRDPERDGRLKQNRDRGVSMRDRYEDDEDDRGLRGRSQSRSNGQGGSSRGGRDDDEYESRSSRGGRSSSRSDNGQGEVRDPEHDGRLKQNRDRGVSMSNQGGSSRSGGRYQDDEEEYSSRNRSSSRSSGGRSRSDDDQDRDEQGRFTRGGRQDGDDGRGEVRNPEYDGRLKQNRDRGVSMNSQGGGSRSSGGGRSGGGSQSHGGGMEYDEEADRYRDEQGRFVSDDEGEGGSRGGGRSGGRGQSQGGQRSRSRYEDDEDDVQQGGQGRVKDPEHDRRLSQNR